MRVISIILFSFAGAIVGASVGLGITLVMNVFIGNLNTITIVKMGTWIGMVLGFLAGIYGAGD